MRARPTSSPTNCRRDPVAKEVSGADPQPRAAGAKSYVFYFEKAGGRGLLLLRLLIVQFVYEKFGADAFNEFLRDPLAGESILGIPLSRLYDAWKE